MRFYGLEIGCNKILKAEPDYEVVTITIFGRTEWFRSAGIPRFCKNLTDEFWVGSSPVYSPDVSKIPSNLNEAKESYGYIRSHFKIPINKFNQLNGIIGKLFPPSDYVQLSNK